MTVNKKSIFPKNIFDKFLHQPEMHILASARKYFVEIFRGTGKGLDEKGKHNIALYLPAENVQNSRNFDLKKQMSSLALCRLHS